jgi:uncharacterized repeat protein (TIGR02543 family)
MKKRILSILLALCMMICLIPTSVFAEGETNRKVETEQELVNALSDGSVDVITLKSDIEIGTTMTVDRNVTLDIYGYMLEMSGNGSVIRIKSGGHLTLKDSDPTSTYKFTPDANGLWKWGTSGTKTVHGGVIYGGTGTVMGDFTLGGGVCIEHNGQLTMTGGNIVGCTATGPVAYGGGVCNYGSFTMTGGNIIGCTAVGYDNNNEDSSAYGGGVYVNVVGQFNMNGGNIVGCTATGPVAYGGGIFAGGTLNISGDVRVSDCTAGGTSSDAMHIYSSTVSGGTFYGSVTSWGTISGGTFYDGVMNNYGTISGGTFYGGIANINDGTVSGITVTYQVNGADYAKQILRSGTAPIKPDEPTKDGYAFIGWFDGDSEHDFTAPVTGDITLTGKWERLFDKTADFTAADGGAQAIALLNAAKTSSEVSTWDSTTKTLTLKGISFATTATIAVKLPDGTTVITADGTENRIIGGGATVSQDGGYTNSIYIYGIYVEGALTVQGEANGTGKLYVRSGNHINSDNAWTYTIGVYTKGDLAVKSGFMTVQGGKATSTEGGFSYGVRINKGGNLSITGGTLTAVGGESLNIKNPNDAKSTVSVGTDVGYGNITVSGSGKLIAENVPSMASGRLSFGVNMINGELTVKDNASVLASSGFAIHILSGNLKLSGGKLRAYTAAENGNAVTVTQEGRDEKCGCIEISGGEFDCAGNIYMYQMNPGDMVGLFSVIGGKAAVGRIYGTNKLSLSNGTLASERINANAVELSGGSLTVREPVYKDKATDTFYPFSAISCKSLNVSGGTLDAAWDWGEYMPIVFPKDNDLGYAQPLINLFDNTASISGGTVILDTVCTGNTALKAKALELSGGIAGSGYTNETDSDTYIQTDGNTPVKFAVRSADYNKVDAALDKAKTLDRSLYKDFSAVDAAVNAVDRGKNITEQAEVDAMAAAIENAIAALEYKAADYGRVDEAIARAKALNKDEYKDFSAVDAAVNAVDREKNITEQAEVNAMATAIENAIAALEKAPAAVNPSDKSPRTGNASDLALWISLLFVSGGAAVGITLVGRKKKRIKL